MKILRRKSNKKRARPEVDDGEQEEDQCITAQTAKPVKKQRIAKKKAEMNHEDCDDQISAASNSNANLLGELEEWGDEDAMTNIKAGKTSLALGVQKKKSFRKFKSSFDGGEFGRMERLQVLEGVIESFEGGWQDATREEWLEAMQTASNWLNSLKEQIRKFVSKERPYAKPGKMTENEKEKELKNAEQDYEYFRSETGLLTSVIAKLEEYVHGYLPGIKSGVLKATQFFKDLESVRQLKEQCDACSVGNIPGISAGDVNFLSSGPAEWMRSRRIDRFSELAQGVSEGLEEIKIASSDQLPRSAAQEAEDEEDYRKWCEDIKKTMIK